MRTYNRKTNRGQVPADVMERAVREVLTKGRPCRTVASEFDIKHVTLRRYVIKARDRIQDRPNSTNNPDNDFPDGNMLTHVGYFNNRAVFNLE